eukprot:862245-Pleurochrysis_carterae.AAC.1
MGRARDRLIGMAEESSAQAGDKKCVRRNRGEEESAHLPRVLWLRARAPKMAIAKAMSVAIGMVTPSMEPAGSSVCDRRTRDMREGRWRKCRWREWRWRERRWRERRWRAQPRCVAWAGGAAPLEEAGSVEGECVGRTQPDASEAGSSTCNRVCSIRAKKWKPRQTKEWRSNATEYCH